MKTRFFAFPSRVANTSLTTFQLSIIYNQSIPVENAVIRALLTPTQTPTQLPNLSSRLHFHPLTDRPRRHRKPIARTPTHIRHETAAKNKRFPRSRQPKTSKSACRTGISSQITPNPTSRCGRGPVAGRPRRCRTPHHTGSSPAADGFFSPHHNAPKHNRPKRSENRALGRTPCFFTNTNSPDHNVAHTASITFDQTHRAIYRSPPTILGNPSSRHSISQPRQPIK